MHFLKTILVYSFFLSSVVVATNTNSNDIDDDGTNGDKTEMIIEVCVE